MEGNKKHKELTQDCVITSYSIHYTKLYEFKIRGEDERRRDRHEKLEVQEKRPH